MNKLREKKFEPSRNFATINVAKGFMNKVYEILATCNKFNLTIVMLQDLGLSEVEVNKHFESKDNVLKAKAYVMAGYVLLVNPVMVNGFYGYAALAINEEHINTTGKLRIRKGTSTGTVDGRVITLLLKPLEGKEIAFISIYAPNLAGESDKFFCKLEKWLYKLKRKNKNILIGGDFNATINGLERYTREAKDNNNQWPSMINDYGIDGIHLCNPCDPTTTWQSYEENDKKADIDHIIIDCELIKLTRTTFKIDQISYSDHAPILTNLDVDFQAPPPLESNYDQLIDCEKLTAQNKLHIQEDLCKALLPIEEVIIELERGISEEERVRFSSSVNEMARTIKEIALKYAAREVNQRPNKTLPFGWTLDLRNINKEIWMCKKLIEKLEDFERDKCNEHYLEIIANKESRGDKDSYRVQRRT